MVSDCGVGADRTLTGLEISTHSGAIAPVPLGSGATGATTGFGASTAGAAVASAGSGVSTTGAAVASAGFGGFAVEVAAVASVLASSLSCSSASLLPRALARSYQIRA